jgi:hypothetical protein
MPHRVALWLLLAVNHRLLIDGAPGRAAERLLSPEKADEK